MRKMLAAAVVTVALAGIGGATVARQERPLPPVSGPVLIPSGAGGVTGTP